MDELIKGLNLPEGLTSVVNVWQIVIGVSLSALLSLLIGTTYRRIYSETSYSQTLVQSFVMMSMITTFIMALIGSNIARAFSLVGALSIIRFRTAIKSPLDVAFVFLSIAVGMGCGTGFYALSLIATALILGAIYLVHTYDFAAPPERREVLLSVQFRQAVNIETVMRPALGELFEAYSVAYAETLPPGDLQEVVYSVRPRPGITEKQIIDSVSKLNDQLKVSYRLVRHAVDIP